VVKLSLPDPILKILSPKARPFFKTKPEIIRDRQFKVQLQVAMLKWQEFRQAGLQVLDWWELIVKPGIKRLAIIRSKEIKKQQRGKLNMLLLKQSYYTRKLQEGELGSSFAAKTTKQQIHCQLLPGLMMIQSQERKS
jgi:hypothetical protein